MERLPNKADLLITSDWHLREKEKNPVCRLDNYYETQWKKVDFIASLQRKYGCPVVNGGDLFDHWKPSPQLLSDASNHIPAKFWTIYGQHDLPQHNMELAYKSGLFNLWINEQVNVLPQGHWGDDPSKFITCFEQKGHQILVWHVTTFQGTSQFDGMQALRILKEHPQFDLIITGDNHKAFVEEYQGRYLVNPGSIMRMDADQIDFRPRVYAWCAETNKITPIFIPIEKDVISREHIDIMKEKNDRIDAYINRLNDSFEVSASFETNVTLLCQHNKIHKRTVDLIYKAME